MRGIVYLRLRQKFKADLGQMIRLGDLAGLVAPANIKEKLMEIPIHRIEKKDNTYVVIDIMKIIEKIALIFPDIDIQNIGPPQTIIEVSVKKRKIAPLFFLVIWLLLFIGAALTIMNFHEDVAMREVHQKIYSLVTGKDKAKPLILQIPYSFGLGIGMILFFNHIFKKRFNEEPSPLEVEMFNYQQDLDRYVIVQENQKTERERHDFRP